MIHFLLGWPIFRGYVSFREWNCLDPSQFFLRRNRYRRTGPWWGADTPKDARTGRFVFLYWLRIWRFSFFNLADQLISWGILKVEGLNARNSTCVFFKGNTISSSTKGRGDVRKVLYLFHTSMFSYRVLTKIKCSHGFVSNPGLVDSECRGDSTIFLPFPWDVWRIMTWMAMRNPCCEKVAMGLSQTLGPWLVDLWWILYG